MSLDNITETNVEEFIKLMEKNGKKIDKILHSKIEKDNSLKELLEGLTRDELNSVGKKWGMPKFAKLNKKQYAEEISEAIRENFINILFSFNIKQIELLKDIVENNGSMENKGIGQKALLYYRGLGILFSGTINNKKFIVIPKELIDICKESFSNVELMNIVESNDENLRITRGLLYYYGALTIDNIINKIEGLKNKSIDKDQYLKCLKQNSDSDDYLKIIYKDEEVTGVCNSKVSNFEKLIDDHTKSDVEFYELTYKDAFSAGEYRYSEWYKPHMEFYKYILNTYEITKEEAMFIVDACIMGFKDNASVPSSFEVIKSCLPVDDVETKNKIVDSLMQMRKNTRIWRLKGNMPKEVLSGKIVNQEDTEKLIKKKTGRNDPCTCGSGKKYKKCCGGNYLM